MNTFVYLTALCTVLVQANPEDTLFTNNAGSDSCLSEAEFTSLWLHFDANGDHNVTKLEFDTAFRREGYSNNERAPLFFEELDRVPDEILNEQDFHHVFRLFDEDGNGCIAHREFTFNWKAYFEG